MTKHINRLRGLRVNRRKPLTVRELAERIGFSKSQVSDVETGRRGASDKMIAALARFHRREVTTIRRICEEARRHGRKAA